MDVESVRNRLRRACERAGSQSAFAREAGVSYELVRLVLAGKREPAGLILDALGVERVVGYRVAKGKRDE